jgi:hypothetical protein
MSMLQPNASSDPAPRSIHPRIAELLAYLDRQAGVLRAAYDAVPPERRAVRPVSDRWSPAEIVHHVVLVNRRLLKAIGRLIDEARTLPRETETSPVVPTLEVSRIIERTKKFTAAESAEPKDTDPARVWADFDVARRELRDVIASADGLAMGAVSAPHPMLGNFNGYEWIAFAGAHAARHADQIREIMRT